MRADLKRLKRDTESGTIPATTSDTATPRRSQTRRLPGARRGRSQSQRSKLGKLAFAAALLTIVVAGVFLFTRHGRALTEKDAILVTDFVNTTADPVFDGTLKKALAVDLTQSPYLNVFPEQKVRQTPRFAQSWLAASGQVGRIAELGGEVRQAFVGGDNVIS